MGGSEEPKWGKERKLEPGPMITWWRNRSVSGKATIMVYLPPSPSAFAQPTFQGPQYGWQQSSDARAWVGEWLSGRVQVELERLEKVVLRARRPHTRTRQPKPVIRQSDAGRVTGEQVSMQPKLYGRQGCGEEVWKERRPHLDHVEVGGNGRVAAHVRDEETVLHEREAHRR